MYTCKSAVLNDDHALLKHGLLPLCKVRLDFRVFSHFFDELGHSGALSEDLVCHLHVLEALVSAEKHDVRPRDLKQKNHGKYKFWTRAYSICIAVFLPFSH